MIEQKTYSTGNRCGHNPLEPRFYSRPPHKKNTFDVINIAQSKMKKYYYHPEDVLQNIRSLIEVKALKDNKNPSKQRTEAREAISSLTQVIIDHADLATLRAVKVKDGKMHDLTIHYLAKKAGLSYKRAQRAFSTLKNSRYLKVDYKSYYNKANVLIKVAAIKRISNNLFYDLGISAGKLERCRNFHNKNGSNPVKFTPDECKKNLEKLAILTGSIIESKKAKNISTDTKGYYTVNQESPKKIGSVLSNTKQKKEIDHEWVKLSKAADSYCQAALEFYKLNKHRIDFEGAKSFIRSQLGGVDPEAKLTAYNESKKRQNC